MKSMRNGQTAAIGPPKASSYLARGEEGNSGGAAVLWWSGYLVDRTTLLNRGNGMHPSALGFIHSANSVYYSTLMRNKFYIHRGSFSEIRV